MEWTTEIPKEIGTYWFYGNPFDDGEDCVELHLVEVWKISNGFAYVASGNFMSNKKGFWQKAITPELPKEVIND